MQARQTGEQYYQALQDRDLDAVIAILAPDCRAEVPGTVLENREAIRAWMAGFFDAFADVEHETRTIDVAGDIVSAELRIHGHHTRPLVTPQGTIPATNRLLEIHARNRLDIRDGAIANLVISFDLADFMKQLGIGQ